VEEGAMILASHQPDFLPWMGFFYKMFKSDVFVLSDDVMFSKSGMHNYNYINMDGRKKKITIPVHVHGNVLIKDVEMSNPEYNISKLCRTLRENYSKAPFKNELNIIIELMEDEIKSGVRKLSDFNSRIIYELNSLFQIRSTILMASWFVLKGNKDERLLSMCKSLEADTYYSGKGAKAYHDYSIFGKENVNLVYSDYETNAYTNYKGEQIENLSVIDYIANYGFNLPKEWRK
jgi:hypothetical protein